MSRADTTTDKAVVAARAAPASERRRGLAAVYDERAQVLVLGSFPGLASLAQRQYYAHPRNQFWPIIGRLLACDLLALPYEQRLQAAKDGRIAIWDAIDSCVRPGSLDSNIEQADVNKLSELIERLPGLRAVAFNGRQAAQRGLAHIPHLRKRLALLELPSTSPTNAILRIDQKFERWRALNCYL